MAWSFFAVGAVGMLIGLRFRVWALLGASAATVISVIAAAQFLGLSSQHGLLTSLFLVLTLQCAYLIGLIIAVLVLDRDQRRDVFSFRDHDA